jgi:hypothetical protein
VQWVVDVYHVMLYLHAVVSARDQQAARRWVGQRVVELIEMDGPRFIEHMRSVGPPDASPATAQAWDKLLNYLQDNRDSLWYGRRLKEGLPIGSGLIEGGGKSTLARRLKINSARWRIPPGRTHGRDPLPSIQRHVGNLLGLQARGVKSPQCRVTPPARG